MKNNSVNDFEFGSVVQEEMLFKDTSYLEVWPPFCSAKQNRFCYFERGYHEEQFCEIILYLDQWFRRRCCLKDFLSRALVALVFSCLIHLSNFGRVHLYGIFM